MESLIKPDDHWMIWTFLVGVSAVSILLEARYKWAKKVTGAVLALSAGMIASSVGVMPSESASYDIVWTYIIPISIPLLLMKMNVLIIFKETRRLMGAFHLSALGTLIGTVIATVLMYDKVEELTSIAPVMAGSYIGGGVNFVALASAFEPSPSLVNATLVADSVVMVLYFGVLIVLPSLGLVRRFFPVTERSRAITGESEKTTRKTLLSRRKPISYADMALALTVALIIATLSEKISVYVNQTSAPEIIKTFFGQKYLLLTSFSVLFPLLFPKLARSIRGNDELGTLLIFIFFVAIGLPAKIGDVLFGAPLMLLYCAIILFFNFLITIVLGKLFKYEIEELVLAGTLTAGGPMNGAAIAASKQWNKLVVPSMMVGVWGYIIGNYMGYLIAWLFL